MRSPLFGRRVHIAGSIAGSENLVSSADIDHARILVTELVKRLSAAGANFVVPVDAERLRASDGRPVCFDWLIWQAVFEAKATRPTDAPGPMAIAVQHHKTEEQIPQEFAAVWDSLRRSPDVTIESAAHWNMNSKRMETQARFGDILVTLGGSDGVLYLANLYHDAGKPVVPLNLPLGPASTGARRLYDFGLTGGNAKRLFRLEGGKDPHAALNLLRFPARQGVSDRVEMIIRVLEQLERPFAFAVRLLNPEVPEFDNVERFFDSVVRPVVENDFGHKLMVIDAKHAHEYARVDQEIFERLHRSGLVVADITGSRPNCFLELGYSLGRQLPTIVTAREGSETPFDITTFGAFRWRTTGVLQARREAFRDHVVAMRNRPPLVSPDPLIP